MDIISKGYLVTEHGRYLWSHPGIWNEMGEVTTRKFHLVFVHWSVALCFILGLIFLGLYFGDATLQNWRALSSTKKTFWVGYIVLIGLTAFNSPFLTHSMLGWGLSSHIYAMFWSIIAAAIPVVIISANRQNRSIAKRNQIGIITFSFLLTYMTMAVLYLNAPTAIE